MADLPLGAGQRYIEIMCVVISCETCGNDNPVDLPEPLRAFAASRSKTVADTPRRGAKGSTRRSKSSAAGRTGVSIAAPETSVPDDDAAWVSELLAARMDAPLETYPYPLRWINVQKGLQNPRLLSSQMRPHREWLVEHLYRPYCDRLHETLTRTILRDGFVVHLTVRTFTLKNRSGTIRRGDLGMAYDPKNEDQKDLVLDWIDQMYDTAWMVKARRNFPRGGATDSIIHTMTDRLDPRYYLGIGLDFNRALVGKQNSLTREAIGRVADALKIVLDYPAEEAA